MAQVNVGASKAVIDEFPDECPICYRSVTPSYVTGAYRVEPDPFRDVGGSLQLVFQCPASQCRSLFFGVYEGIPQAPSRTESYFFLRNVAPKLPKARRFPKEITSLSERFTWVYIHASAAETLGLFEVVGPGYRKALEILVKDFAATQRPSERAAIERAQLGQCINDYISDSNVQECARRAAWLGNDETHYVRKWEDKDIGDLKTLIELTVNWIHNSMLTERYKESMPRGS